MPERRNDSQPDFPDLTYTLYHNPRCGKSRQTLELLRERGIEPTVVEYLKTPPDAAELCRILGLLGLMPRQLLRKREAAEAGLDDPTLTDDELIAGMVVNPITIERPILVTADRAALGRPPEAVLALL
jgi:arsenate reductase